MFSRKLKGPIADLDVKHRSLLFAELAQIAYSKKADATKSARSLGFTTVEYYNIAGAQAYRFMNKDDFVIACRGTEPTEFNDIKADLNALPTRAETVSFVHKGFKDEVDKIWPTLHEDIEREADTRTVWFCGHSLGAAMATIVASRCTGSFECPNPAELYTYGSPRVGFKRFVQSEPIKHYRWVNNNDIVTRVPMWIMGYRHDGERMYLNTWGNVRKMTGWQRFKDKMRGMWRGIKQGKIDAFSDHSMGEYVRHIFLWSEGKENPQK